MPNAFILSQVPAGYGSAISMIIDMLVGAGWTYKASGDGVGAYSATGKVFTHTEAGVFGWGNAKAWARLADPGGGRELILQTNGSTGLRIKYSFAAHFVGGVGTVTQTPSAADERPLWGGGTDAVPTYGAWFGTGVATATNKFHGAAMGGAPYGFWVCGSVTPGGAIQCGLMLDPVSGVSEDPDPVVFHIGSTGAYGQAGWGGGKQSHAAGDYLPPGGTQQGCFAHRDASASAFEMSFPSSYLTGTCANHGTQGVSNDGGWKHGNIGGAVNPFNGKYDALPIPYLRAPIATVPGPGVKGWSTMTRWPWIARMHAMDTMNARQWIAIGVLWLRWDGVTQPTN